MNFLICQRTLAVNEMKIYRNSLYDTIRDADAIEFSRKEKYNLTVA